MRRITKSHGKLRPYRIYDALDILENHPYQVVKIDGQPYLIEAWKLEDILTPKEIEQLSLPDGQELDLKTLLENIGNSEYKKYLLQSTVTPPTVLSWMLAHQYEDIFFEKESEASHDLGERPLINPAKPVIATSLETAPSEIVPLYSTLKRESVLIEEQWLKDIWHKHQSCPEVEGVTLKITPTRVELPIINKDDKVYFSLGEWILYTLNGSLFAFYDYGEQGCKYADRTLRAENFTFAGNNHPARLLVSGDFARPGATEYLEQRLNTSPKEKEPYQLN